jgi:hypothetical protein
VRRLVAFGAGLILLVLIVLGINACSDARNRDALAGYNRDVAALEQESETQVAQPFFAQLSGGGGRQPLEVQTRVNQLAQVAESQLRRARNLDVPGAMRPAQDAFVQVLTLRRDGVRRIADRLPTAFGARGADQAIEQIARQMQLFLASDVLFNERVVPSIRGALEGANVSGQSPPPPAGFLRNLGWLDQNVVTDRLTGGAAGGAPAASDQPATPGLHGHGLQSVSLGGVTLQPGGVVNRVAVGSDLTFQVAFQNQGDNPERNVDVRVTLDPSGGGGQPVVLRQTVPSTSAGAQSTATLTLTQPPTPGTTWTAKVEVAPVPGEKKTDNNAQSYTLLFTS